MVPFEINHEKQNEPKSPDLGPSSLERIFPFSRYEIQWSNTGFRSGPRKKSKLQIVVWSWFAATIDSLLIFALSCFSAILVIKMLGPTTMNQNEALFLFAVLFVMNVFVYLLSLRLWLGYSIGEWACELRLGPDRMQRQSFYLLQVFTRICLNMLSGFIVFPILSIFYKKDLLGSLIGLRLTHLQDR